MCNIDIIYIIHSCFMYLCVFIIFKWNPLLWKLLWPRHSKVFSSLAVHPQKLSTSCEVVLPNEGRMFTQAVVRTRVVLAFTTHTCWPATLRVGLDDGCVKVLPLPLEEISTRPLSPCVCWRMIGRPLSWPVVARRCPTAFVVVVVVFSWFVFHCCSRTFSFIKEIC